MTAIKKITKLNFLPETELGKVPVYADKFNYLVDLLFGTGLTVGSIQADTISEVTSGTGVTVDGVLLKDRTSKHLSPNTVLSADGAISIPVGNTTFFVTKGSAAAITIADPTATTHDGLRLTIVSTTAFAHTISNAEGSGFNNGGAGSDVATFTGAIGNSIVIEAYQGKWYVVSKTNATLA